MSVDSRRDRPTLAPTMRARLIIAALIGAVVGLTLLAWIQDRQLRDVRLELTAALSQGPELPLSTNQRPLRLRLHSLPPVTVRTAVQPFHWSDLESEDYATYIQNLRNIGCPEETIRDIIVADIDKLYAHRARSLSVPQSDWTFWRHPDELPPDDAALRAEMAYEAQLAQLDREKRVLLQTLLGESATRATLDDYASEAATDRDLRFLPEEKRQAMAAAKARHRLAIEAADRLAGEDENERYRTISSATKEFNEFIAGILTPQELTDYELRSSPLADELRERLRGFGASRDEFQRMFELEKQFEQDRDELQALAGSGTDPQASEKLEARVLEHEKKVEELLGPQRHNDYVRVGDPDYQTLYSLAKDHAVPTELANQVWTMRQEVETQTDRIRANPFLSVDQKVRALEAIRAETQSAIVDVLGEPLLADYQREGGGWLVDLTEPTDLGETGREMVPPPLPVDLAQPLGVPLAPAP